MKSKLSELALLGSVSGVFYAAPASASVVFQLSDATLQYGGEMTGTITFNDALTMVTSLDLTVPGPITAGAYTFQEFTYTTASPFSVSYQLPVNAYVLDLDTSNDNELQLAFGDITAAGVSSFYDNDSYDHQTAAGNRVLTGGSLMPEVTATPLPGALPLFAGGLSLVGSLARRRKKTLVRAPRSETVE